MFRVRAGFPQSLDSFCRELATSTMARALALSLMLHFAVIAGAELGRNLGFWRASILPQWAQSKLYKEVVDPAQQRKQERQPEPPQVPEAQLVFVDVDPSQAAPEPPKDTPFYSAQNTAAANPDTTLDTLKPKIDGQQDKVPKTMDTLRSDPKPAPPEPAPKVEPAKPAPKPKAEAPPAKPAPKVEPARPLPPPEPEKKPEPEQKPGETLMARANPRPQAEPQKDNPPPQAAPKTRPRTLAEAKAQKGIIEGQKAKQEGGVRRHAMASNLDVRTTPFGSYDQAFIMAVQARWFSLLDEREFVGSQAGKVTLDFRLNQDGRITDLRVAESQVSELLSWFCQRAVLDPAPYKPFPADLRRVMNADYREIRFTFYYNQ